MRADSKTNYPRKMIDRWMTLSFRRSLNRFPRKHSQKNHSQKNHSQKNHSQKNHSQKNHSQRSSGLTTLKIGCRRMNHSQRSSGLTTLKIGCRRMNHCRKSLRPSSLPMMIQPNWMRTSTSLTMRNWMKMNLTRMTNREARRKRAVCRQAEPQPIEHRE